MNDEQRILDYLWGDLEPEERTRFEESLRTDPALQEAVESHRETLNAVRKWYASEPPGIERADGIAVPVRVRPRPVLWKRFSMAAVFLFGFVAGCYVTATVRGGPAPVVPQATTATEVVAEPTPAAVPAHVMPVAEAPERPEEPVQRIVREENGRIYIETTLASSGSRAVWIVDGDFRLEGASKGW